MAASSRQHTTSRQRATSRQRNLSVVRGRGEGTSRTRQNRQTYVYGDAVPAPAYDPGQDEEERRQARRERILREQELRREQERREEERRIRQQQAQRQVASNRRRAMYMSPGYVMFLGVAAAVALLVCVNYVNLQSQITSSARNVTVMQEELSELREENNTRYNALTDSVNMAEVQERASELGMVYAAEDQIVEYNSPTSDYVRQYEDIPVDGLLAQSD